MTSSPNTELHGLLNEARTRYAQSRRVLSFDEFVELFGSDPRRYGRDAARYLKDCFDHYGSYELQRAWGPIRRVRLFDQEFLERADGPRVHLVGHEELQNGF